MIWLLVPVFIWTIALLIMGLPQLVYNMVQRLKRELSKDAKLAKRTNPDESIYKRIEVGMLEIAQNRILYLISSIIGVVLIALGTVAFCAILLL